MKTTTFLTALLLVAAGALVASHVRASTIVLHSGSADPVSEGWSVSGGGGTSSGPVASDVGGYPGWQVTDPSTAVGSFWSYSRGVSGVDAAEADADGWKLSVRLRTVYAPDDVDLGVWAEYIDGSTLWRMMFGTEADGDAIVQLGASTFAAEGSGSVHHLYELYYDPNSATVDLFVDGIERISDFAGAASASAAQVNWGSGGSDAVGNGIYNLVQLQLVPEPTSIALLGLGMVAIGGCAWRRRKGVKP